MTQKTGTAYVQNCIIFTYYPVNWQHCQHLQFSGNKKTQIWSSICVNLWRINYWRYVALSQMLLKTNTFRLEPSLIIAKADAFSYTITAHEHGGKLPRILDLSIGSWLSHSSHYAVDKGMT